VPIYRISCSACGKEEDVYRTVKEYDNLPDCCGSKMQRMVTAPYVIADIQPYQSMIDGSWITSRSRHNEHLREHKCVEIGNETHHLKPKTEIDVSAESKARRKQEIIDRVNALS
jgi:putative FmdB family regulatory protein